jgi:uncharacterized protein YcfJ
MKFREIYFHTIAIVVSAGFLAGFAGVAQAESNIEEVRDHYKTVIQQKPYRVEVCRDVTVPGDKTGDALTGAIIGGIIGNNVTKNVDNGGAVGALLGGIIGHNNSKATGGTQRQCSVETRYQEESREVYSHSTVTFTNDGKRYTVKFNK